MLNGYICVHDDFSRFFLVCIPIGISIWLCIKEKIEKKTSSLFVLNIKIDEVVVIIFVCIWKRKKKRKKHKFLVPIQNADIIRNHMTHTNHAISVYLKNWNKSLGWVFLCSLFKTCIMYMCLCVCVCVWHIFLL